MRQSILILPALALLAASVQAQTGQRPPSVNPKAKYGKGLAPQIIVPPAPLVGGADSCVTPDVLVGVGTFGFDNTLATRGTEGQTEAACLQFGFNSINADVWFTWTAPLTGNASITSCNLTTIDTKIAVYAGNTCPTGAALACNDDNCGGTYQTSLSFACTSGSSYVIQLGNSDAPPPATPGAGVFSITAALPATNDDCSTPVTVVGNGPFPFDNSTATTGAQGQTTCTTFGSAAMPKDVWFTWQATFTGVAGVRTCGQTGVDTKIAVYAGTGCAASAGPALGCNDDSCASFQSEADLAVVAGQLYTIQIGLYPFSTAGGTGTFDIFLLPPPPSNDDCTTPIALAGPGTYGFDTTWATTGAQGQTESACLFFGSTTVDRDLWYTYTATTNGSATVTTCALTTSPSGDSKIAVYSGAGCPTLPAVGCNDDDAACGTLNSTVIWPTVCGTTYTIQVGRYPGAGAIYGNFSVTEVGTVCVAGVGFCFGDGTGTACPCANNGAAGNGCASSLNTAGANLASTGSASVTADTAVLTGTGMPNSSALYFQGTSQVALGAGTVFGDGKRCAGGTVIRLSTKSNVAGASSYPVVGDLSVSVKGLIPVAGGTRTYQVWYRNAAVFCTVSTFNLSNGLEIVWLP